MPNVPLRDLAHARSGDKGAGANVAVFANDKEAYHVLRQHLTASVVQVYFAGLGVGPVERYEVPNLLALNFLLPGILAGGGSRSLRTDAQGKALGPCLLELWLELPQGTPQHHDPAALAKVKAG